MIKEKKLENGFEYLEVTNDVASAKIALQGAHIFEFKRQGKEDILWLSPTSAFEYGTAIRGGVPICWPRFGTQDKTLPAHGFSRTAIFKFDRVVEIDATTTEVTLYLEDDAKTRKIWDFAFRFEVIFTLGKTLTVEMKTFNRGTKEFMITQALHTYFGVSNILNAKIEGLENRPYLDTLTDEKKIQQGAILINEECDRVYQEVDKDILLWDKNRCVSLKSKGSSSAVVWNPWIEKGSRMSGMKADAYKEFLCIETANAFDDFRVIKPDSVHSLSVSIF